MGALAQVFGQFWTAAFWREFVAKIVQTLVEASLIAFGEGIVEYVRVKRGVTAPRSVAGVAASAFHGGPPPGPSYGSNYAPAHNSFSTDRTAFGFPSR